MSICASVWQAFAIYDFNMELLSSRATAKDAQKMDYVAYFFAASQAMLIQKWIYDGFVYTPEELAALYDEMTQSYWLSTFDRSSSLQGKHLPDLMPSPSIIKRFVN